MSEETIWDCAEAAAYLKIHPRTLIRMAREGLIPGFRIGKLWRFRAADLDSWAATQVHSLRSSFRSN
jgi:excisionase family DNA binding protein